MGHNGYMYSRHRMSSVWGISYGTIIGQYLIKILPPNRVGRVIIDAVVNPTVWAETSKMAHTGASGLCLLRRRRLTFHVCRGTGQR
jgi:hypothetical protein